MRLQRPPFCGSPRAPWRARESGIAAVGEGVTRTLRGWPGRPVAIARPCRPRTAEATGAWTRPRTAEAAGAWARPRTAEAAGAWARFCAAKLARPRPPETTTIGGPRPPKAAGAWARPRTAEATTGGARPAETGTSRAATRPGAEGATVLEARGLELPTLRRRSAISWPTGTAGTTGPTRPSLSARTLRPMRARPSVTRPFKPRPVGMWPLAGWTAPSGVLVPRLVSMVRQGIYPFILFGRQSGSRGV